MEHLQNMESGKAEKTGGRFCCLAQSLMELRTFLPLSGVESRVFLPQTRVIISFALRGLKKWGNSNLWRGGAKRQGG